LTELANALGRLAAPAPAAKAPVAPAEPTPAPAPRPAPVAAGVADHGDERETADLAGSLLRFHRLVATHGYGTPSLEELIADTPISPARSAPTPVVVGPAEVSAPTGVIAPIEIPEPPVEVAPTDVSEPAAAIESIEIPEPVEIPEPIEIPEPVEIPEPPQAVAAEEPVPIADLCYSGDVALERALGLQERVRELVAAHAPSGDVQELIEEVFDLIRLGRAAS
jgi:hypothetical protein